MKALHFDAVSGYISTMGSSKVFGVHPHRIFPVKSTLPRSYRTTRTQLSSGYYIALNSYKARVGFSFLSSCLQRSHEGHTVPHSFRCSSFTHWTHSSESVGIMRQSSLFISSLPVFYLPPLFCPLPEPLPAAGPPRSDDATTLGIIPCNFCWC